MLQVFFMYLLLFSSYNVKHLSSVGEPVGAACKVSANWSQETMTCHSFNCFSIVWGQGNTPLVTSPRVAAT